MLRPLRRLPTALSLLALLAVVLLWARAQWVQDIVVRRAPAADGARTLRLTTTTFTALRGSLMIERKTLRWELTDGPAAEEFRQTVASQSATIQGTREPSTLLKSGLGLRACGFLWRAGPPTGERTFTPHPSILSPGWSAGAERTTWLAIPWWFLALCSAILPTLSLRRRLRTKRHRPGTCPQCGYDLRASPTRCPECGRPIDTPPTSQPSHS